jgi:nicotinate-nucleotide adenylyltransferase
MRVALFGGSFDPPHVGHVLAMAWVLSTARVDRVLMVPCFVHPFDKRLGPFEHRLEMARLAAAPFGRHVEVSDVERRLGGESRTLLTVKALRAERPDDDLLLAIGADLLRERERWYGYPELASLVEFIVIGRLGHASEADAAVAIPDVSSTEVRARLQRGESVEGLVPAAVADYVAQHSLYRRAAGSPAQ